MAEVGGVAGDGGDDSGGGVISMRTVVVWLQVAQAQGAARQQETDMLIQELERQIRVRATSQGRQVRRCDDAMQTLQC